ncbi:MAG: endopeptidase La [Alphaproteobacteria bacterium]|nr:endopeptidase La [Alphaproteobacteria bacterium]
MAGFVYPVLALRDIVVLPGIVVPLFVGRNKSIKALEVVVEEQKSGDVPKKGSKALQEHLVGEQKILLLTQRDPEKDDPIATDLYAFGTIASVLQYLKLPDGTVKVLVEGLERARVLKMVDRGSYFVAAVEPIVTDIKESDKYEVEALMRAVLSRFEEYMKLNKKITPEIYASLSHIQAPDTFCDTVASHLNLKVAERQEMLEMVSILRRLEKLYHHLGAEIGVLQTEHKVRKRVDEQMKEEKRKYFLNEQIKALNKELNDGDDLGNEVATLSERIEKTKLSKEAAEKAKGELKKLKSMNPMAPEATVIRNYLDWLLMLPWNEFSKTHSDLETAETILNRDHYGLEKINDRILEYLAVQLRTQQLRGPILCLVGPPGVGKTSIVRAIAEATGRTYVRMSLGGVRDEAEIRGHRRTYIGSMPGRIIQAMKKAKTSNPLILLDEIDKMSSDYRGDPAAALLEVLDPEQNAFFQDHYLEVEYDLSHVMFVATANSLDMPRPLADRMEIIRIAGYAENEKMEIAKRHLLPRIIKEHGIKKNEWKISDEAVRTLIQDYTREAGVRSLERELAKMARKSLKQIISKKAKSVAITQKNLSKFAGVKKFSFGEAEKENFVGVTNGLAYTEVGGDLLTLEAVCLPGKGHIKITGKLGDVMQESIQAAASYVRSHGAQLGITPEMYQKHDIHVHVPEGAVPKDGPSAGVGMVTSIVSAMTNIPIHSSVAMTGEITLRGRVLPIGGLKEKLLGAIRGGIKTVIIPKKNMKDLEEIQDNIKGEVEIIPVSTIDEVLAIALERMPKPVIWETTSTGIREKSSKIKGRRNHQERDALH